MLGATKFYQTKNHNMSQEAIQRNPGERNTSKVAIEIRNTLAKGKGVFSLRKIKRGETVLVGAIEKELRTNHSHATQIDLNRFVLHEELNRTINHSCTPNCGIKVNSENGALGFVAIRDIEEGEEILYDYAMRNYNIEYFPDQCQCKSTQCRGKVTGWKDLSIDKKLEYRHYVAPYLLKLDTDVFIKKLIDVEVYQNR